MSAENRIISKSEEIAQYLTKQTSDAQNRIKEINRLIAELEAERDMHVNIVEELSCVSQHRLTAKHS